MPPRSAFTELQRQIVECRACPRLVAYREQVARDKRRQFKDWEYWGKPLTGFGDPRARVLLVGLAPAAHGGNRTGRMFTGDRSGDWLFRALHRAGFASQPDSVRRTDGLRLSDAYITAAIRCAPPQNKPSKDEVARCREYLVREIGLLGNVEVVVVLGRIAMDAYLATRSAMGIVPPRPRPRFRHGVVYDLGDVRLVASYHPSQQNTLTGRLTRAMLAGVFTKVRRLLGG
jgi:uracil-DNA glycosylase family 4